MAICRQLSKLMGGQLAVESVEGSGSRFYFDVELATCPCDDEVFPGLPEDLKGKKVLLVEENTTARQVIATVLEFFELIPMAFGSVEAALKMITTSKAEFDLLMLDVGIKMPNGTDVLRTFRSKRLETPVIMIGFADPGAGWGKPVEQDGYLFLKKPILRDTLLQGILSVFGAGLVTGETVKPPGCGSCQMKAVRILIVDDHPINHVVAAEILRSVGLQPESAESGAQAIQMAGEKSYDLILMDIRMAGMDGYETTHRLRAIPLTERTPIVAMTAGVLDEDRKLAFANGMNDFLPKPLMADDLIAIVNKWCRHCSACQLLANRPKALSTHATPESDLPALRGLDLTLGLRRCLGKKRLYLEMVEYFVSDYETAFTRISDFLKQDERAKADFLIHKVKGVSGNISATRLFKAIEDLEACLKNGDAKAIAAQFQCCQQEHALALESAQMLKRWPEFSQLSVEAATAPTLSREQILDLMGTMDEALKKNSLESKRHFSRMESVLARFGLSEELQQLEKSTRRFDFTEARKVLAVISQKIVTTENHQVLND